ncbi:MAG: hypothetical protein GY795_15540 [Desulfobacterales bacterium]|nr:hypothetical protein [Desulfobacterales bacterium]
MVAYGFVANFSAKTAEMKLILKDMAMCLKNMPKEQKTAFIYQIEKTISDYPKTDFSELFKRIKDADII